MNDVSYFFTVSVVIERHSRQLDVVKVRQLLERDCGLVFTPNATLAEVWKRLLDRVYSYPKTNKAGILLDRSVIQLYLRECSIETEGDS